MVNESADLSVPDDCQVSSENLPLVTNDAGEKVFRFYWLDAHEDYFRHPGIFICAFFLFLIFIFLGHLVLLVNEPPSSEAIPSLPCVWEL